MSLYFMLEFNPLNHCNSGDVCPIDVDTVDGAEEAGYCLTLKDGAMAKFFLKNDKQENEFSVHLNISKV